MAYGTFRSATRAKLDGDVACGSYGGIPFPVLKAGAEVIWNHQMRWRGSSRQLTATIYQVTADGKHVLTTDGVFDGRMPIYLGGGAISRVMPVVEDPSERSMKVRWLSSSDIARRHSARFCASRVSPRISGPRSPGTRREGH